MYTYFGAALSTSTSQNIKTNLLYNCNFNLILTNLALFFFMHITGWFAFPQNKRIKKSFSAIAIAIAKQ
jgi:hypothetical protein